MGVAYETIIQKMMIELQKAKSQQKQDHMIKHIENVRLLCDLFLTEDAASETNKSEITAEEMVAMTGEKQTTRKSAIHDDDANGGSIFDF